jgi:hypothetical protein
MIKEKEKQPLRRKKFPTSFIHYLQKSRNFLSVHQLQLRLHAFHLLERQHQALDISCKVYM